jgi:hypothetical protein
LPLTGRRDYYEVVAICRWETNSMKTARWGLMILLVSPVGIAAARPRQNQAPQQAAPQQQDPVAAAARRTRDQKKDQPKTSKVYDNDSLPTTPGGINIVGQAAPADGAAGNAPATDQGAAPAQGQANAAAAANSAENAAVSGELTSAKEKLQSLQKDLDILQRTFTLDQQMYLSKPDHDGDKIGGAKLKNEQSQMADKQQEIADAQKKIDELQSKLAPSSSAKQ